MNRLSPDHVKFELLALRTRCVRFPLLTELLFFRNCTRNFFLTNLLQIVLYKSFETYLKVSLTSSLHYVVFKVRHHLFGGAFDIICALPPVVNIFFKIFKEKIEPSEST